MTTTVTLKTHDWPVEVTTIDQPDEHNVIDTRERVEPHTERVFHATSTRALHFKELPAEAAGAEQAQAAAA